MELPEPLRLVVYLVSILGFLGLNAAYLVWVERKVSARFQRRLGPTEVGPSGLLQPIADGVKLLSKQFIVPPDADRVLFKLAPVFVLAPAMMCMVTIPFSAKLGARDLNLGLLLVFAFGSINVLAILLAGWASRNKYSIIASARVVAQNVAYEIPTLLVVTTMLLTTGTMNLREIVLQQAGGVWSWNILKLGTNPLMPILFLILFVSMLAETNRAPFDLAEAESELVAGAFTEYAGMGFGVFFMAEYANVVVGSAVGTVLFLGGWYSPVGVLDGLLWFLIKLYVLVLAVMWIRWTFPRTQFYRLLNLSWKILIPCSLFALVFTALLMKLK